MFSRYLHLLLFAMFLPLCLHAAAQDTLTAEQARQDATILAGALRALHPALDKYRSQSEVNASFARFQERAGAARSPAAMYLAATELAASIRCGHTWTNVVNQQAAVRQRLLGGADKLPLTLALVEGRWLVLGSTVPGIAAGDELLTIAGQDSAAVRAAMLPYLRADGGSDGKRLRQLGHDRLDYSMMDIIWPLLSPPVDGVYPLTVRTGDGPARAIDATATTLAARAAALQQQGVQPISEAWQLRIDGDLAVMTLPTFALYRSRFDWRQFFSNSFAELNHRHIARLVIDIRNNEGGDDAIGAELLSWLIRSPLTYVSDQSVTTYERVPYKFARFLDTWDFGFFDRTGQVDRISEGPQAGRWRFRPSAQQARTIAPRAQRYAGKAWLLIGPENSSATFLLAQLVKQSGAAVLAGQPTGGNLRGLNGGQLAWVTLPNSGVAVDIPLLATSYSAATPDAPILPDVVVQRQFAKQAARYDQELEAVLQE
ncbi:S41 family peptidase [Duganella sp. sic0402]|uniref:S41 family peptidase n=1 Tax=Duganella sp. sic0402 TaxID=2854786 RepID=UPI001C443222|nr:S41 family peptidase [Duganella sp. sic0402]MBV7537506.1 S41 family peptidase [Duganella sp. sic0402]